MSASVTDTLKKQLVQSLYDDVLDSASSYYIGLSKSEPWDDSDVTPTQGGSLNEILDYRMSLQSVKLAETISFIVPRVNWINGTIYDAWRDDVAGFTTNYHYVMTSSNSVYICIRQGKNANGTPVASVVEPTGASTESFTTSDGYTWKFLFTLNAGTANNFLSANFMPVKLQEATDSDSPATDIEQENIQNAAVAGQLASVRLINQGAGYTSVPTVTIEGDGTGAQATATLSGGKVVKVELDSDGSGTTYHGSGYTYARVVLSGGGATTDAIADAIQAPINGFGADPRDDLKSVGLMFNAKTAGDESGDFIIGNDFRQVGLIKNITHADSDSVYTNATGMALNQLVFDTVTNGFTADRVIEGSTSGARGIIDYYDYLNTRIYYHQNDETGFGTFVNGESVTEEGGSGSGSLHPSDALIPADVNNHSGSILYIENRAAIDRAADQTEDIKLVIQF